MIILSDSDVVEKLAYCELLLEFLQLLKCPPNEVWVLPSLHFRLKRRLKDCPHALRNVEQFMARVRRVPPAKVETLDRFTSLDVGEQQLVAVLCDEPRVKHLVTGDKRAMDKIAALSFGDAHLKSRLDATSIYCFESVMIALLKSRGFSVMQARVLKWSRSVPQIDGVALQAFPAGGTVDDANRVLNDHFSRLRISLPPIAFEPV